MRRTSLVICALLILFGCARAPQTVAIAPSETTAPNEQPLILERDEGEQRQWRYPGFPARFTLKVDSHNGHSSHFVFGTEDFAPGEKIQMHKHPSADEILFLQNGQAKVTVAGVAREVHGGSTVFIPANTWLSLANNGSQTIGLIFIFSAPGFEDFMRAESAGKGQKLVLVTPAEDAALTKKYASFVIYK